LFRAGTAIVSMGQFCDPFSVWRGRARGWASRWLSTNSGGVLV